MNNIIKNPFTRFVAFFSATYVLLILLHQIGFIQSAHHTFFTKAGSWVYNTWHPNLKINMNTDVKEMGANEINDYVLTAYDKSEAKAIRLHNAQYPNQPRELKAKSYMAFQARMSHLVATFFLLSLIVATPNTLKRKIIGSLIGLYLLYILVAMKLTFLLEMSDGRKTMGDGIWYSLSGIIGNNESYQELFFILVIAIWILVSLSKKSIDTLTTKESVGS